HVYFSSLAYDISSALYAYLFLFSYCIFFFLFSFFFFNDTATTEIYTLSLHDALPICRQGSAVGRDGHVIHAGVRVLPFRPTPLRSEEHTSELQSLAYLVCRLLLEKKKKKKNN